MKNSTMFLCFLLAMSFHAQAEDPAAKGSASATSDTAVSANRSGVSATDSNTSRTSANTPHTQADSASNSEMNATLSKSVDARKAKPGDPVTATNDKDTKSADGTSIKRGSTLVGHVTKSQPLDKSASDSVGAQSMLSVVFDKAILKDGREIPLNATIQAVSAAESDAVLASDIGGAGLSSAGSGAASARGAGGGLLGNAGGSVAGGLGTTGGLAGGVGHGVNGAAGGVAGVTTHSVGAVGGLNSSGMLTSGSRGVFGINGLDFASSSAGGAEGSVITSSTRNVRLEGGTRMLLANSTDGAAMASGAAQGAGSMSHSEATKDSSDRNAAPSQKMREPNDKK
jgi:hypothetical protein